MKDKAISLLKVSRPAGWVLGPLFFTIWLVYSGAPITLFPLVQLVVLTFPYCLFLFGMNDIYDYESDKINPRKHVLEGIKLDPVYHPLVKKSSLVMVVVLLLSAMITLNPTNIMGMLVLLFFSLFYSTPPLRLKEHPPLDSISNGMAALGLAWMGFSFGGSLFEFPLKGYSIIACMIGIHAFTTIMDYTADKEAGDRTFAVVLGKRAAALFPFIIFLLTFLFSDIRTLIINYYFLFCSGLFLIIAINPSEKLASYFFKLLVLSTLITTVAYILIILIYF